MGTKKTGKISTYHQRLAECTAEQLREALVAAVRDMGNSEWDDEEVEGNALGYVRPLGRYDPKRTADPAPTDPDAFVLAAMEAVRERFAEACVLAERAPTTVDGMLLGQITRGLDLPAILARLRAVT